MGADVIGWRRCPLQQELGEKGFLGKLKMKAYLHAIEAQVPEGQRETVQVTVMVNDAKRDLTYPQIRAEAEAFQRGIPECATCPLSGGQPLGCYHYVKYPVDARFEEVAFEYFCDTVQTKDSICDQLYSDIISRQPTTTAWHTRRGPGGGLATLPEPLTYSWGGHTVDSAQLLATLFITLPNAPLVIGLTRFWRELVRFADRKLMVEMKMRGIEVDDDGSVNIAMAEERVPNLADELQDASAALGSLVNGTLGEIRSIAAMMQVLAPKSLDDGWHVIVDG